MCPISPRRRVVVVIFVEGEILIAFQWFPLWKADFVVIEAGDASEALIVLEGDGPMAHPLRPPADSISAQREKDHRTPLHGQADRPWGGTGLRVYEHIGFIRIEGVVEFGTTFRALFPVLAEHN
jgi:hypothetical protein